MTVVLTGGSSGFGALAARRIGEAAPLLLGARRPSRDEVPLDLASLDSVRDFAARVTRQTAPGGIAALVFNAGSIPSDAAGRTVDGFETSFAVNYLGHYLLLRLLLPRLAPGAVLVWTSSGAHDPETGAGLVPPRHAEVNLLAHPDRDPHLEPAAAKAGQHAYTAAKLCVVLAVRGLAVQPAAQAAGLVGIAYDPGQVFGTGLARNLSAPMRLAWSVLGSPAGAPIRRFNPTLNGQDAAGLALADLALARTRPPSGRYYAALRRGRLGWIDPSELARDPAAAVAVWQHSGQLLDLPH